MTSDELVQKGLLRSVSVLAPSPVVVDAGNKESLTLFESPMGGFNCYGNAISVVRAMRKLGEPDWDLVLGFGIPEGKRLLRAHAWTTGSSVHYDPTWIRWKWDPALCRYFELIVAQHVNLEDDPHQLEQRLSALLEDQATTWRLQIATSGDDD